MIENGPGYVTWERNSLIEYINRNDNSSMLIDFYL